MKKVEKLEPKGPKPTDDNDFISLAEEVKVASYEERSQVNKHAKKLQTNLQTGNPSFVKSMSGAQNYEDVRKQRLLENKRRFEELGLTKLSREIADMKKRQQIQPKDPKPTDINPAEPRRSSRAHNAVSSYHEIYLARPQVSKYAEKLQRNLQTRKERAQAYKYAEKLQSNLQAGNLSFVKSMHPCYVGNTCQMVLPPKFCGDHLPKSTVDLVLENEEGSEYGVLYIGNRTAFSGQGWRAFALDHKLAECDALVFELIEPTRFKVYVVRASDIKDQNENLSVSETLKRETKNTKKVNSPELQDSAKSKKNTKNVSSPELQEKSPQVSAPRRSLRER